MSSVLDTSLRKKLAGIVAMLASDNFGDRKNAARVLFRTLERTGCSFVDLAWFIDPENDQQKGQQKGSQIYTEADLKRISKQIYERAFAEGQQFAQQQAIGTAVDWLKMAEFVARYVNELGMKDREFADGVIGRIRAGVDPSPKQQPWLKDIYVRLGRRHGFAS
jgi:hypothetical protein